MATFVEELIARLALDTDEQSFKKGEKGIDDIGVSAVKMGAAIAAAFSVVQGAITAMVVGFANNADATNKLARRLGTTAEAMQEIDYIAQRSGISVDSMRTSLERLSVNASEAAGGSAALHDAFKELGIDAKEFADLDPSTQFDQLARGLDGVASKSDKMRLATKLFGREGKALVTAFEGGADSIAAMRKEAQSLGLFSSEDAALAEEFNDRLLDMQMSFGGIKNAVSAQLLPVLTDVLIAFRDFFVENRALITSGIVRFFKVAAVALKGLAYAAGLFLAFKLGMGVIAAAQGVLFLSKAFSIARVAALLFNASVLLIPILIGAAVAALALLAEDMYTFFEGGDSYIGRFVKKWPALGEAIYGVADALKVAFGFAGDLGGILLSILTMDFGRLMDSFQSLGNRIIDVFRNVGQAISDSLPSWVTDSLGSVFGAADSVGSAFSGASSGGFLGASPMIAPAAASAAVSNSSSRTMQDNRQYNITGTDIGEVKRVLNEKNAFAAKTIDTGVEY